jgi:hypothetical protein
MIKAGLKPYASIKGPVQQQLVKLQVGGGLLQWFYTYQTAKHMGL